MKTKNKLICTLLLIGTLSCQQSTSKKIEQKETATNIGIWEWYETKKINTCANDTISLTPTTTSERYTITVETLNKIIVEKNGVLQECSPFNTIRLERESYKIKYLSFDVMLDEQNNSQFTFVGELNKAKVHGFPFNSNQCNTTTNYFQRIDSKLKTASVLNKF